ncbi:MAG TPA: pyrroloquinoline quinone biosynthesis protein PqqB [Polyangiales bacterium]|nr:pyrroloquinoline quinone biosynthesis protein PqqB [Polyangiales bacterium]
MHVRVLGSAAGGGFPQWNCGCENCRAARSGARDVVARTQESVAVSADGESWFLLNASPEVRAQIESFPALHPRAPRHSPIAGIVLTNGDLDHCLGLLSLRESYPLGLYATASVERGFREGNVLHRTLQRFAGQLRFEPLELAQPRPLTRADGSPSGLTIEAVPVPGKLPIHLEKTSQPSAEDNIGLLIREPARGRTLGYFPAVAAPCPPLTAAGAAVDCLFLDGTFWSSDELPRLGLGEKRAEDMAHWPIGGEHGSLQFLQGLLAPRKIYIHINNTNPVLRSNGSQAAQLTAAGIELAHDGLEFTL